MTGAHERGDMELEFFGAAQEVTGSCYLLRCGRSRVLVDCGLIQGGYEQEQRNREPFPFDLQRVDAVVLTHAHLDHSGRVPLLVRAGYKGPIYTQRATRDLLRIMLKDAAYLNEREAQWANRKRARKGLPAVEPLYTQHDATAALRRIRALDYDQMHDIAPGVRIRLRDAGHILGSAIVELWASHEGLARKLVFSGDLGHAGAPILRDPVHLEEADLVVMESTYGDRCHRSWAATWEELGTVLAQAQAEGGNILIPAFAVGRTQELLYAFREHYTDWGLDRWHVFLDSPMAIEATDVYMEHRDLYDRDARTAQATDGNPLRLPNLYLSRTAKQSMGINRIRSGALIIAGSGMCTGGRIKHHLKHNIWRANTRVLFVGFQARGTPGRALVDGAREITLWGETMRVAATIHTIGGFSAHADQEGLAGWYGSFRDRPPVALTHGEPEAMATLAALLQERFQARVLRPEWGTRLDLHTWNTAPGAARPR